MLCDRFRDDRRSVGLVLPHPEPQRVERRHHQERQDRRHEKAAHDGDRHRSPEDAPRERDHAENRGQRGQHHRPRAANRGINDGAVTGVSRRDVALDLIDQDDGVAHDHAGECDQPKQRHETERPVGSEQRTGGADQSERGGREDQGKAREALQLDHQ